MPYSANSFRREFELDGTGERDSDGQVQRKALPDGIRVRTTGNWGQFESGDDSAPYVKAKKFHVSLREAAQ